MPNHDFTAPTVEAWAVRGLSALAIIGAAALPWWATWQGVLRIEGVERRVLEPEVVQYRPELVLLPGGEFMMGSPETEEGRDDDELQHKTEVAPFYMCRTEVTVAQWWAVMGTTPSDCDFGCEDEHPVQNVSWNDACAFMNRLSELENEVREQDGEDSLTRCYEADGESWVWKNQRCTGYRLPTETEWEYAARAETETAYSFGNGTKDICLFGNTRTSECDDKAENLAAVGSYQPNRWGLYDLHGNVWEWVYDWYAHSYPVEASRRGYAGPDNAKHRVLRGGSFGLRPDAARSAARLWIRPTIAHGDFGVRCARSAPELSFEPILTGVEATNSGSRSDGGSKNTVEPVLAKKPTKPTPDSAKCMQTLAVAAEARSKGDFRALLGILRDRHCWRSEKEHKILRTLAYKETKQFARCVQTGKSINDDRVRRWVSICERRLEMENSAQVP